jgi:carboxypeptidase C (cathepsin A)
LISPALEFSMIRGDTYMVAPLAAELPTIAATHLEQTMDADGARSAIAEAEAFAWSDYLTFLASGRAPDEALLAKLSHFSGLSPEIISRNNGRVTTSLYRREYRRAHDRALSMYDGSVSIAIPRGPEDVHVDPILDAAVTVLKPAMELYARSELNFQTDLPYYLLNREVSGNWDFGTKPNRQGFAGALDELQQARTRNPGLSVLVAAGYTDFVIPYSGSQLLVRQLSPIEGAKPVSVKVYAGGHMMYLRPTSRRDLKRDAAELYASAQAAR